MLLHHGDAFVVDVAAVVDGIHACLACPQDGLSAVGVCGDFAAETVSIGDDSLHLFTGVLGGLRIVALGEDAAGGTDLNVLPDHVLHGWDAIRYRLALQVVLVGQKILVHVAAGDTERRA